ncbi:hypothetical protein VaNZ11_014736, partial [Volvox africanus]
RKSQGVGAGEAANLLNAIYQNELDDREFLRILGVDQTPCDHLRSPCRASRKDNVACFCQLVPGETAFRKKGLWKKEQAHLATLGQDPTEDKRENAATPVGLRNLGNTCYANAALQCLFSIPTLRNGILNAEAKVAAHDIFRQLQALLLHLQFGPRSCVDTQALADTLGLDHAIQQDGQEFLKLLLTRVEQMLNKSSDPAARGIVQRLFRGGLSYVTTCQRCGRNSASSHEVQDFYDLMPQVRGFSSLVKSMAAILHVDHLTGDNRYFCEFCGEKVDALRHVRLRKLPPYLFLALQRFYFNPRTADKAKALDEFSFPLQLDFRQVLETAAEGNAITQDTTAGVAGSRARTATRTGTRTAAAAAMEMPQYATASPVYELVAILIHKGSQASSGHYVAHIKDQASGQWWRFDDESVDCIGPNPTTSFQADHGRTIGGVATGASNAAGKGAGSSRKRPAIGDPGEDPDYDNVQEAREQQQIGNDERAPKVAKEARGKQQSAEGRSRTRPSKRGAGTGRGRRRAAVMVAAAADDGDAVMARAMAASLELHNGGGQAADAQDDEDLRRALASSLLEQRSDGVVVNMAEALEESSHLHATGTCTAGLPGDATGVEYGALVKEQPGSTAGRSRTGEPPGHEAPTAGGNGQVVSANAYMLVYRAVGFEEPPVMADASCLTDELQAAASAAMDTYAEQCEVFQRKRQAIKEQVEGRQQAVRRIMAVITPQPGSRNQQPAQQQLKQEQMQEQEQPIDVTGSAEVAAFGGPCPPVSDHAPGDTSSQGAQVADPSTSQEELLDAVACTAKGTLGYWISTAWLEQWANEECAPPPIDNYALVCNIHGAAVAGNGDAQQSMDEGGAACCGRLDPRKVTAAKLVSPEAWKQLLAAHGGGPTLACRDVCRQCLAANFNATLLGCQVDVVRSRVAAILEGSMAAGPADEASEDLEVECMDEDDTSGAAVSDRRYWVSRLWLQGWSKRQGATVKAEKSPTADITCCHGQLLHESIIKTARRVAVPHDVWCFLRDLWRQQRVKEAQESLEVRNNCSSAIPTKGSRGSRAAGTAVDCLDLTGNDQGSRAGAAAAGSGGGNAMKDPGVKDDDDDCVVEVLERNGADVRAVVSAPPSREATADADEVKAAGIATAATLLSTLPAVPTPRELEAMCPDLQVGRVRVCRKCRASAGQAAEAKADTRRLVDAERAALGGLAMEVVPIVEPGTQYYLVPSAWVREWQRFVRPMSRRTGTASMPGGAASPGAPVPSGGRETSAPVARPGQVTHAMLRLLCPCHPNEALLGVPAPRLSMKRNKVWQLEPEQDPLRIIKQDDWQQLCALYESVAPKSGGVGALNGARSRARMTRTADTNAAAGQGDDHINLADGDNGTDDAQTPGRSAAAQATADVGESVAAEYGSVRLAAVLHGFTAELIPAQAVGGAGSNGAGDPSTPAPAQRDRYARDVSSVPGLRIWPPVCSKALAEHTRAAKEAKLSYQDVEVMVELVPTDELEGAFRSIIQAPERKARRSRKGRIVLEVSNTTTLEQLKLQIYQHMHIHPSNQALYVRGEGGLPRLLEGDDLSLAQHEVVPDEEIRVVRRNVVDDDDDIVGLLGTDNGRGKKRQVEEGFKNTALHGDLPQQQQQHVVELTGGSSVL